MAENRLSERYFRIHSALEQGYWWHRNRISLAVSMLAPLGLQKPTIMDLGCGPGGFLESLSRELGSERALGVDMSPAVFGYCRDKGLNVMSWDLNTPLDLGGEGFDLITAMDVLEHLDDEKPLIETVVSNLKPGGYFLASVPAIPWLFSEWDRHAGHLRRYSRKSILNAVTRKELAVLQATYAFSYALVPGLLVRFFGRIRSEDEFVFPKVSNWMNDLLCFFGRLEGHIIRFLTLPGGLSIYVLSRRKFE